MHTYRVVEVLSIDEVEGNHYMVLAKAFHVAGGFTKAEPDVAEAQIEVNLKGPDPRFYLVRGRKREKVRMDRLRKFLGMLKAEGVAI